MKSILTALFCLAGLASAQTSPPPPDGEKPKWIQKVIDVKYANTDALAKLLGSMQHTGTGDRVTAQLDLHAISIGSYDPSFPKLAEEIIQRYDVPAAKTATEHQHGVEIVAHILIAAAKGSSGDALPADLEPVAKQLRSIFGYTDIRLLDSALIRGLEARGSEVSGTLGGSAEGLKVPPLYRIRIKKVSVEPDGKKNSIALEGFSYFAKIPYDAGQGQPQYFDLGFDTDLSIQEGQKVVVGKTRIGASNEALILVLSARVVE